MPHETSLIATIAVGLGGDAEAARLSVRDSGKGIPADQLDSIFDPFAHLDPGAQDGDGTRDIGIGLALARRLAVLHGGALEARSEGAGKGTELVVRLPRRIASAAPARSPEP